MPKLIHNRIKAALAEKQLQVSWLANELGFSLTAVSRWCQNQSQPEIENLFKIAKAIGVEPGELLVTLKENVPIKKKTKTKDK